jgi:hypothetical protein
MASMSNLLTGVDYNPLDKITHKAFGNDIQTNYTYRTNNLRLDKIQTINSSGSSYQNSTYAYDNVGDIMSIKDNVMNYNAPSLMIPWTD